MDLFLSWHAPPPRSILVLPATVQRMRRYLGFLCQQAPQLAHNLVVVNGDAISFHNVYRDRDFAWNVLDLPVPVVFFAHRNPVDPDAGLNWRFSWTRDEETKRSTTGTHDLLLYRDIVEAMIHAAFVDGRLLGDADQVQERLWHTCWLSPPPGVEPNDFRYHRVQNALNHSGGGPRPMHAVVRSMPGGNHQARHRRALCLAESQLQGGPAAGAQAVYYQRLALRALGRQPADVVQDRQPRAAVQSGADRGWYVNRWAENPKCETRNRNKSEIRSSKYCRPAAAEEYTSSQTPFGEPIVRKLYFPTLLAEPRNRVSPSVPKRSLGTRTTPRGPSR